MFGHYDSRGGTIAVAVSNKDTAIEYYADWTRFPDTDAAAADYMGCAQIACVSHIHGGVDLEWGEGGRVIPDDGAWNDGEHLCSVDGKTLTYRADPVGSAIDPGPRWDDDAFSFILLRAPMEVFPK